MARCWRGEVVGRKFTGGHHFGVHAKVPLSLGVRCWLSLQGPEGLDFGLDTAALVST